MQEKWQDNQLFKTIIIMVTVMFAFLIIFAIVQTFVLKGLDNKLKDLENQNQQTIQQIEDTDKEIQIRESEDFNDEILKREGYGNDGDVIVKFG